MGLRDLTADGLEVRHHVGDDSGLSPHRENNEAPGRAVIDYLVPLFISAKELRGAHTTPPTQKPHRPYRPPGNIDGGIDMGRKKTGNEVVGTAERRRQVNGVGVFKLRSLGNMLRREVRGFVHADWE